MLALAEKTFRVEHASPQGISSANSHVATATRARNFYETGALEGALREYRKLLSVYPDDPDLLALIGAVLWKMNRLEEAESQITRALSIEADPSKLNLLGVVLGSLGRLDEALGVFERAQLLDSDNEEVAYNGALALARSARFHEAIRLIDSRLSRRIRSQERRDLEVLRRDILEASLWKLVDDGFVEWSGGKPRGTNRPVRLTPGPPVSDYVIEDRR
jgi:Flp pilus assembly protein TadD